MDCRCTLAPMPRMQKAARRYRLRLLFRCDALAHRRQFGNLFLKNTLNRDLALGETCLLHGSEKTIAEMLPDNTLHRGLFAPEIHPLLKPGKLAFEKLRGGQRTACWSHSLSGQSVGRERSP